MNKPKLPREVAKAINTLRMGDVSDYGIVALTFSKDEKLYRSFNPVSRNSIDILRRFTFSDMEDEDFDWKISSDGPAKADVLLKSLVNGYEIEEEPITVTITPEQINNIRNYYMRLTNPHVEKPRASQVLVDVVNKLGIEIEGVNKS